MCVLCLHHYHNLMLHFKQHAPIITGENNHAQTLLEIAGRILTEQLQSFPASPSGLAVQAGCIKEHGGTAIILDKEKGFISHYG